MKKSELNKITAKYRTFISLPHAHPRNFPRKHSRCPLQGYRYLYLRKRHTSVSHSKGGWRKILTEAPRTITRHGSDCQMGGSTYSYGRVWFILWKTIWLSTTTNDDTGSGVCHQKQSQNCQHSMNLWNGTFRDLRELYAQQRKSNQRHHPLGNLLIFWGKSKSLREKNLFGEF